MFRFTIRDLVLLTLIVALGVGWWIDHRRLTEEMAKLKLDRDQEYADNAKMVLELIARRSFPQGQERIDRILEAARKSPPPREDVDAVLLTIRHDSDFRNRIRAMAVIPYFREREEGIDVLLEALRERTGERSADGVIPSYAATYLAEMKATRAIAEMKDWLDFLKQENSYDNSTRPLLIKSAEKRLAELMASAASP